MKQFLILVFAFSLSIPLTFADDSAIIDATGKVAKIGMELTKTSIQDGNIQAAEQYSKFTTDSVANEINELREENVSHADDLHLLLIDIHSQISESKTDVVSSLNTAESYLDGFAQSQNQAMVASEILSVADQTYQTASSENNSEYYTIAGKLVGSARISFDLDNSFEARQKTELQEFFSDLQEAVNEKKDFVAVGKLITTIQRDLAQTNDLPSDKDQIYDKIQDIYKETNTELQKGDYAKAEELVIAAYLDNFEFLEGDIGKADDSLLETMEQNMRVHVRDMIVAKKSPQEIAAFIDDPILKDLEKSKGLIAGMSDKKTVEPKKSLNVATDNQKSGVRSDVDTIRDMLETMLVQYQNGQYTEAFTSARSAYLDSYEHVEVPLRSIDPDFTLQVELEFSQLRQLISEKADYAKVQEAAVKVRHSLDESERLVTGTGEIAPAIAFTSSFAVIFREGLESVLILGAILTYLEASRNTKYKKYVFQGIAIAVAATAVTWAVASYVIEVSGTNRELIEAVAALSATAVLFYVSFWILNKIEHKKWMEFVKAKVWQASTTGGVMVFVMLSFFTVYREGFETVLFYEAMFGFAKHMELFVSLGFVLGIGVLLAVYYITRKLGKRLPLKMLFGLTMGVGAYLSVAFLGNAIRELQNLDILPFTSLLGTIPRLDINMAKMTGIYPTVESLVGQAILLGVYLVAASYVLVLRPKREEKIANLRKSRKEVDEFEAH
ncbi:MAG: FTR1 family protein [Candidatus Nitrosotenuis sp.]